MGCTIHEDFREILGQIQLEVQPKQGTKWDLKDGKNLKEIHGRSRQKV